MDNSFYVVEKKDLWRLKVGVSWLEWAKQWRPSSRDFFSSSSHPLIPSSLSLSVLSFCFSFISIFSFSLSFFVTFLCSLFSFSLCISFSLSLSFFLSLSLSPSFAHGFSFSLCISFFSFTPLPSLYPHVSSISTSATVSFSLAGHWIKLHRLASQMNFTEW